MTPEVSSVRFFNPSLGYSKHKLEFNAAIQDVLARGALVGVHRDMETFEANLAGYTGKKYAVALNSGTDALYLSLWALGIGEGDEVIVPSHTFVASAQVVHQLGAKPVIVDVHDDLLMHEQDVIDAVTLDTKAIIPVHLTGDVCSLPGFVGTNMIIVEDAAQALGAKGVGYGDTQCYSFYPAKILGSFGDAGAITTDNKDIADKARELRNHWKSDYSQWGINSRMDNLQAAVLNIKMRYLSEAQIKRWQVAQMYEKYLNGLTSKLILPKQSSGRVWQDYVIRLNWLSPEYTDHNSARDALYDHLKLKGIETMKNEYPMPIAKAPNSFVIEKSTLRIPCNENLTHDEIFYVINGIKSFFV